MKLANDMNSWLASIVRLGRGLRANPRKKAEPAEQLRLYEFEACPYCRKVREVMSELDLDYLCFPTAKGSRHRREVIELGGKAQFPFLVDPKTDEGMYESEDIITYLAETYGDGRSALGKLLSGVNSLGSGIASAVRPLGRRVMAGLPNREGIQPVVLFNFEASPYCRKVRERLAELDLAYEVRNVAKQSAGRPELVERGGKMQVPYLVDPNTGTEMYESDDINRYLTERYAAIS